MLSVFSPIPKIPSAVLYSETATALARGALNFSGGKCLNPKVADAIVDAINLGADTHLISTIFKNAFDYGYQKYLFALLKTRCKDFSLENYCRKNNLQTTLLSQGIDLLQSENGSFSMIPLPFLDHAEENFSKASTEILDELDTAQDLRKIIVQYVGASDIEFSEKLFKQYADIFCRTGNHSFKRQFLKQAIEQGQQSYVKMVFEHARNNLSHMAGMMMFDRGIENPEKMRLNLSMVNLSYLDLSGLDLHLTDLSYSRMFRTNLKKTNLSNASLDGVHLCIGQFDTNTVLVSTTFEGATLTGTTHPKQDKSKSQTADFTQLQTRRIHFSGMKLKNVNLSDLNLAGHSFKRATFTNVDVTGTDLSRTDFCRATLINVNLKEASSLDEMIVDERTLKILSSDARLLLESHINEGRVIKKVKHS